MVDILLCNRLVRDRWSVQPGGKPFWRLYWNRIGDAVVRWRGRCHALRDDRLLLIPPYTPFEVSLTGVMEHFYIHFRLGAPWDWLSPRVVECAVTPALRRRLDLAAAAPAGSFFQHLHATALITHALGEVPAADWPAGPHDERIRRVIESIEQDPSDRSNAELAALVGMSVNGFIRRFRREVGTSPHQYLLARRLEQCCRELVRTDSSIETIAAAWGFCDRNYFSTVFSRHFGCGPAAYRRRHRLPGAGVDEMPG